MPALTQVGKSSGSDVWSQSGDSQDEVAEVHFILFQNFFEELRQVVPD